MASTVALRTSGSGVGWDGVGGGGSFLTSTLIISGLHCSHPFSSASLCLPTTHSSRFHSLWGTSTECPLAEADEIETAWWKRWWGPPAWSRRLRIHLPMLGTPVRSLVWEDSTCQRATKPMCHNNWAQVPRAHALQQEKPPQWEATREQPLQLEKACVAMNIQCSQNFFKKGGDESQIAYICGWMSTDWGYRQISSQPDPETEQVGPVSVMMSELALKNWWDFW